MRVKTIYCSESNEYYTEMCAYLNTENEIFVEIYKPDGDGYDSQHITLSKDTAIRLVKDLKRQIGLLNQNGGNNE